MPSHARLTDAALAFQKVMEQSGIAADIFGGFAVATLGGPRASKDVDCLVKVNKQRIVALLDGQNGFKFLDQTRQDYVAFIWSDKAKHANAVLVEIFCEQFPGSQYTMDPTRINSIQVRGENSHGTISLLDPVVLFKGKLRACATRSKFTDAADLRWLESHHSDRLAQHKAQFDPVLIGLALRRYPELTNMFKRLGVSLSTAQAAAAPIDLDTIPPTGPGDVQKGLLKTPTPRPSPAASVRSTKPGTTSPAASVRSNKSKTSPAASTKSNKHKSSPATSMRSTKTR